MESLKPSTMRRDVISAYFASGAKVVSWACASALAYRYGCADVLAVLALVRATLGLLNYTTLGLAPAMVRVLARSAAPIAQHAEIPLAIKQPDSPSQIKLDYARGEALPWVQQDSVTQLYAHGLALTTIFAVVGIWVVEYYANNFETFHVLPRYPSEDVIPKFAASLGIGMVFRLCSDVPGALLQVRNLIWFDNLLLVLAEIAWVALSLWNIQLGRALDILGWSYGVTGVGLFLVRFVAASAANPPRWVRTPFSMPILRELLGFGFLITIAQIADYLYAPTDFILINRLLAPAVGAIYTPAVQIDAALLLLVSGMANVLLPKAALAHARGDSQTVRTYYARGTLFSIVLLTTGGLIAWLTSPWLFQVWLHDPMRPTQLILPLVLIHTVVGGSSAVGRSILLGTGKVKPFTVAVLIAGATNVVLSYCFVRYLHLGLEGIILGTIVAVVGRCGIWMPWYVMRTLRRTSEVSVQSVGVEPLL